MHGSVLYLTLSSTTGGTPHATSNRCRNDWGQRPSVIIRGNKPGKKQGIDTVYLLHFGRIVVSGGGFQYQQLVNSDQWPGFYDFNWITSEVRLR